MPEAISQLRATALPPGVASTEFRSISERAGRVRLLALQSHVFSRVRHDFAAVMLASTVQSVRTVRKTLALLLLMLAVVGPLRADEKVLEIRVLPVRGRAPTDLIIQAFISPDTRNRSVVFVIDSRELYASSSAALEADRAPRTTQVRFRGVPEGEYQVRVTLVGSDGERAQQVLVVNVF